MESWFEVLVQLGPGFALAGVLLIWKRADDARYAQELMRLIERQQILEAKTQELSVEFHRVLSTLATSVDKMADLSQLEEQIQRLVDARK
jgi:rhamnogalacturonyl hydrolase YesR